MADLLLNVTDTLVLDSLYGMLPSAGQPFVASRDAVPRQIIADGRRDAVLLSARASTTASSLTGDAEAPKAPSESDPARDLPVPVPAARDRAGDGALVLFLSCGGTQSLTTSSAVGGMDRIGGSYKRPERECSSEVFFGKRRRMRSAAVADKGAAGKASLKEE
ncbi:hypothetical protein HDU67_005598 [Dinochytrium kinnereticum]|nr:hypothetical protein HDU67_005598 [Dinochytrium kinnereticum]